MRILLYKGRSVLSRLIRFRTWSEYSHAALEIEGDLIVDAWKSGVRKIETPHEGHDPETVIHAYRVPDMTDEERARIREFALSQVGRPYDYRGVLRFLSRRDPRRENRRWFCSELVFASFLRGGIELLARVPAHRVSPGELARSPLLRKVPL
jgi:uncharacterized protein YycO